MGFAKAVLLLSRKWNCTRKTELHPRFSPPAAGAGASKSVARKRVALDDDGGDAAEDEDDAYEPAADTTAPKRSSVKSADGGPVRAPHDASHSRGARHLIPRSTLTPRFCCVAPSAGDASGAHPVRVRTDRTPAAGPCPASSCCVRRIARAVSARSCLLTPALATRCMNQDYLVPCVWRGGTTAHAFLACASSRVMAPGTKCLTLDYKGMTYHADLLPNGAHLAAASSLSAPLQSSGV